MDNESHGLDGLTESEEEVDVLTSIVRNYGRARKQPERYSPPKCFPTYTLSAIKEDPRTVKEVSNSMEGKLWKKSMEEEMESLRKNDTWDLVTLPYGTRTIVSKWVFKRKTNVVGCVKKFNAQLVAKGYSQVKGVDFGEILSPVEKLTSIRLLMSLSTKFDIEIENMDVNASFLHGYLEE